MRQYIASEVETIVKDEVTLSLEALIRVGATSHAPLSVQYTTLRSVRMLSRQYRHTGVLHFHLLGVCAAEKFISMDR